MEEEPRRESGEHLKQVFIALLVTVAGWHLVGVTAAAVPPNRYSEAVDVTTDHLSPYFTQNWRLFAPNPIAQDRNLRFQGSYVGESGDVETTDWVDWSVVELDLIRHRLVGNRGGYVTSKLIESLSSVRRRLTTDQRNLTLQSDFTSPPTWDELTDELVDAGADPGAVRSYVLYERATTRLAGDVLAARFPDVELVAVRYAVQITPVLPYHRRDLSDDDAQVVREPYERLAGWREPVESTAAERAVMADFDRRHR